MPVSDRTWIENEIQISDHVRGAIEAAGADHSRVMDIAKTYLNDPEAWEAASDDGLVQHCDFMTKGGHRCRVRLGIATYGQAATLFHFEIDGKGMQSALMELSLPLTPLEREFAADDEGFDYHPREGRLDRTVKVRFERQGKRLPSRYEGDE